MKHAIRTLFLLLPLAAAARAQETGPVSAARTFDQAAERVQRDLEASLAELAELREQLAGEKIPLSRQLGELESELAELRDEYQRTTRVLDSRTLDLSNLRSEIQRRRDESVYLSGLLSDYIRNFESQLHVAELQRHEDLLAEAKLASENTNLSEAEAFRIQTDLLALSLDRLHEALGGTTFEGSAVGPTGLVHPGAFALLGPAALFRSQDGQHVGTVQQRLGSLEPAQLPFANPETAAAAARVVEAGSGDFPLDPTLGNAHKVEATESETFFEHVQKGGEVMWPIFGMAALALLVAIYKWLSLAFTAKPSRAQVDGLLEAVAAHDVQAAEERAGKMRGPAGKMLSAGVAHLREPKELVEEVMYEAVLTTRLEVQRFLPFIAICAASAPLLGLLGTVTGIISTFKLITVFGSGDVKMLSSGISEALITTKFGLIVAIPSLLLHAFLSRQARGVLSQMESAAIALVNQLSKAPFERTLSAAAPAARPAPAAPAAPADDVGVAPARSATAESPPPGSETEDDERLRRQVKEILGDLLAPMVRESIEQNRARAGASRSG